MAASIWTLGAILRSTAWSPDANFQGPLRSLRRLHFYSGLRTPPFKARPHRTEGTYSKYNSIDDKIDDLHYYTTYIKFGLGRATYDASQEIRNKHLTREEGVALVKRVDGEVPQRYIAEVMDHIGMTVEEFFEVCDAARSPHLWVQDGGEWRLRRPVWAVGE